MIVALLVFNFSFWAIYSQEKTKGGKKNAGGDTFITTRWTT
jgi:hypothetical protein